MKEQYECMVCGKLIIDDEGVTTLNGLWVCDNDSCRTLDEDNEATEREIRITVDEYNNTYDIEQILNTIEEEAKLLTDVDDCFSVDIGDNKGLFIQVIDYGKEKEYFIELNNIDSDGAYEPCADYNGSSEFGDIEGLKKAVKNYLSLNKTQ